MYLVLILLFGSSIASADGFQAFDGFAKGFSRAYSRRHHIPVDPDTNAENAERHARREQQPQQIVGGPLTTDQKPNVYVPANNVFEQ